MEGARSALVGDPRRKPAAGLNRTELIRYYAMAAASESASETGFRFHREEEGSRFIFYAGVDPLFGSGENERGKWRSLPVRDWPVHPGEPGGPGDSESGELSRWLKRTARLAAETVYYGYPLVVCAGGEFLPVLFAAWPVSGEELQINPALIPADAQRRRLIWRKLMVLRGVLAEGSEPGPRRVEAFQAALASLVEELELGPGPWPGEGRVPGALQEGALPAAVEGKARAVAQAEAEAASSGEAARAAAELKAESELGACTLPRAAARAAAKARPEAQVKADVNAGAGGPAPAVYDCAILFRGPSPRLPLWLWEDWEYLLERPAVLGELWAEGEGQDSSRAQDRVEEPAMNLDETADGTSQDGEPPQPDGASATHLPLLLSPFSPAERERMGRVLRMAARRRGWVYLDVPAGDHLQEYLFHLILNGWYAGQRVLVLVPGETEAREIHHRFATITSLPTVAIWGGAVERQRVFADLQWVLRCRRPLAPPPAERFALGCEGQLGAAWQELRQCEEMVQRAAEAGKNLAALEKELKETAAALPSSLLTLAEREVQRAAGEFGALVKEVEGLLLEAERVAAGRWYWWERLWPRRRRHRVLSQLEWQVRSLLHRAGLNSGDWFVAPLSDDAEEMVKRLRLLRAAFKYAELFGRYQQLKLEAGAGEWDSPQALPRLLAASWAKLAQAAREAARARREYELDSLPDAVVDRLELLPRLQAELAAAAGSMAGQELDRAWNESLAAILPALPVWILPQADALEPLPPLPALFDLLVVGGAEGIPLAAVLPLAARASSVVLVGDARSEAEALGERVYSRTGSPEVHQQLASSCGLLGLDWVLYGWPVSSMRWQRQQQSAEKPHAPAEGFLRHRAFPLGTLLNRLYFGGNLLPAGPPVGAWGERTGASAFRWEVVRGQLHSPASGSAYNLDEAEAILRLLSGWLEKLGRKAAGEGAAPGVMTVAVVTPFSRQRDLLLHKLAALLPDGYEEIADICVLHLDALSGRCFDVVLASLVLSADSPTVHRAYLARHPEFVYGLLTAARQSLIVVGDPAAVVSLGGIWSELVSAPAATSAPDESFSFIVDGPYPPGSRAIELAYQELFLMQNGWRGQRRIGSP